jgi:tetratricopeptide (TPR) repeat protein
MDDKSIPWSSILKAFDKHKKKSVSPFAAFTDIVIDMASKEAMKDNPNPTLIQLGVEACLARGRMTEALFLSTDISNIKIKSLRAIALFSLGDSDGLRGIKKRLGEEIHEESAPEDRIRLSTVKVLLAASERDMSVIACVMEFDNLLESHPDQANNPLLETMFCLFVVGRLLIEVGEMTRTLRLADTLETMARSRKHRPFIALAENLRGNVYNRQGDIAKAEEHYLQLKEISEKLSFSLGLGMALNNLGTLRLSSVKLEEAMEFLEGAYELMEIPSAKITTLANLAEIAMNLGKFEESEAYLKEAIRMESKAKTGIIEIYAYYAILLTKTKRVSKAKKYLKMIEGVVETSEKPIQKGIFLYARGFYELYSNKSKQALTAFQEVLRIGKENDIFELIIRSKLEMARTHMLAYETSKDPIDQIEVTYHIDDLIQIAREQRLGSLYAEALLLRSDSLRIAGKNREAKAALERVIGIASFEVDSRLDDVARKKLELIDSPSSKDKTLDQIRFDKAIDRVSSFKTNAKIREVPRPQLSALIALNRSSGLPDFVHYFDSSLQVDSSIVSGFITAIAAFSTEFMGDKGLLRSINHEGFTLMMEHTKNRIIALVASKETFDIRYLLRDFAQQFDIIYPDTLTEGGKIRQDFDEALALIEEVFGS